MRGVGRELHDGGGGDQAVLQHTRRRERGEQGELHVPGREAQGIKLGLEGEVEKHSEVLGRSVQWTKTMRVSSVPKYLCVEVGGGCGREA